MSKKKQSLSEQILALSTPKPASFHPDQDFFEDETAAKLCDFSYEHQDSGDSPLPATTRGKTRKRRALEIEEDPKYAGRVVSRRDLEKEDSSDGECGSGRGKVGVALDGAHHHHQFVTIGSGSQLGSDGDYHTLSDDNDGESLGSGSHDSSHDDEIPSVDEEIENEGDIASDQSEAEDETKGVETLPLASLKENMERGKAAREQMSRSNQNLSNVMKS